MNEEKPKRKLSLTCPRAFGLVIMEFAGTMTLTYGLMCSQGNQYLAGMALLAPLFLLSDLTGGSYFNSAWTLISMIKPVSMGRMSIRSGIVAIIIHIVGGICSGLFCLLVLEDYLSPIYPYQDSSWLVTDFIGEILGSFTFISFVLVQTNPQTKFTNDKVWAALIILIGFLMGRTFTFHSGGVLNPGVALGIQISSSILHGEFESMGNLWIFLIGPLIGSLMSLLFYLKIYQPNLKARIFQRKSQFLGENIGELPTQETRP